MLFLEFILWDTVFNLALLPDFTSVRVNFLSCLNTTLGCMPCYCAKIKRFSVTAMWGVQESFTSERLAHKQRSLLKREDFFGCFRTEEVISESSSVLLLFLDIWVLDSGVRYKHKTPLGSSQPFQHELTLGLSVLVVRRVGHMWEIWYWWEKDKGVLDGKDACYIMVQAIYQPR